MTPGRTLTRWALALAGVVAGLLLPAAIASAGEVEIREVKGEANFTPMTLASLHFDAAAGEDNRLSIEVASERGDLLELRVLDAQAELQAGEGCSGGGAAGSPAICTIQKPRPPDYVPCAPKLCFHPVPGTGAVSSMRIQLGDGNNAFDASSLPGTGDHFTFSTTVTAGGGEDWIETSGGDDSIDPGEGPDRVYSGLGEDRIEATPLPDGPDVYDLGPEGISPALYFADRVDYSRRSTPVVWDGPSRTVEGEGDRLTGVVAVIGGSGNDVLNGNENENFLAGGPGDDILAGGFGWDVIVGGSGSDRLRGGSQPDSLYGEEGNDVAFGGKGDDEIWLGSGDDRGRGGAGRDGLRCGPDRDVGFAGRGDQLRGCEIRLKAR